ncbi:MAG: hypothetical protein HY736_08195 [Verrucomicrobia bacterium]|nr:hypothetical protein [Verrucomicrobiota bacterium]
MNPSLRLTGLALIFILLAAAIGWTARTSWRQNAELREGLLIAEQVDEVVVKLLGELSKLEVVTDAAQWQQFLRASEELKLWIETERPRITAVREVKLLDSIAASYARYLADVAELTGQLQRRELERVPDARLTALLEQLTEVRRKGVGQFLTDSHGFQATLQKVKIALLGVLMVVLGLFLAAAYRGVILPLRVKLVETSASLERSQKLASLGVLAAGVAHEIRNPLTAIKARLYTHQKAFAAGSPEHKDTEFINGEIDRLERIVREFLQFARPAEPQLVAVAPAELLRNVRELLAPELAKSSIQLTVAEVVETTLSADPHQIKQLLINLVQNAAESIGEHGRITLRARLGDAVRDRWKEAVILEVEDTGKGIPPDVQQRLFDPFFTTKPSGTGLGLAIAARIVDKHGGALQFKTRANHGTTFGIVLPAGKKP